MVAGKKYNGKEIEIANFARYGATVSPCKETNPDFI